GCDLDIVPEYGNESIDNHWIAAELVHRLVSCHALRALVDPPSSEAPGSESRPPEPVQPTGPPAAEPVAPPPTVRDSPY
ncbi:MAG: hypothetical protein MUF54_17845, partial [Polyangiaceae bacterium]|nr:hypothetical protein [Polyangiaceae bacterium]